MPKLPAARRGDKTGHAAFAGAGGGGRASTAHGVAAGSGHAGASHGARYGAAFAEGRGGVRLEHVARAAGAATKAGEGDQAGPVHTGSPNVLIGGTGKLAARAGVDVAECPEHRHRQLAEGSVTVLVNGKPAARASEKLKCSGGHLLAGCETVLIGGDSGSTGRGRGPGAMSTRGSGGGAAAANAVVAALAGDALANGALADDVRAILGLDGASDDCSASDNEGGDGGARGATAGAAVSDAGNGAASSAIVGATLHRTTGQ